MVKCLCACFVLLLVACQAVGLVLLTEDFEGDTSDWVVYGREGVYNIQWRIGTDTQFSGAKSAFISNPSGRARYTTQYFTKSFIYKEIEIPSNAYNIEMSFYFRCGGQTNASGEGVDYMRVFLWDGETLPDDNPGTHLPIDDVIGDLYYNLTDGYWIPITIQIPTIYSGTTRKLMFGWRNNADEQGIMPGACVDDIVIEYDEAVFNSPRNFSLFDGVTVVLLEWDTPVVASNSATLSGYRIYRDDVAVAVVGAIGYEFLDDTIVGGETYRYFVTALYSNPVGESEPTETLTITTASDDYAVYQPYQTYLHSSYPNPFNPQTSISFSISNEFETDVLINIYNVKGQKIKHLINSPYRRGTYRITFDGTDDAGNSLPSGVYFYQMRAGDFVQTRKMFLMK